MPFVSSGVSSVARLSDLGLILVDIADTVGSMDTRAWAKQHRRMSAATVSRRLGLPKLEAEALIAEWVRVGVLHPVPEGQSYRVRFPRVPKPAPYLNQAPHRYVYSE